MHSIYDIVLTANTTQITLLVVNKFNMIPKISFDMFTTGKSKQPERDHDASSDKLAKAAVRSEAFSGYVVDWYS